MAASSGRPSASVPDFLNKSSQYHIFPRRPPQARSQRVPVIIPRLPARHYPTLPPASSLPLPHIFTCPRYLPAPTLKTPPQMMQIQRQKAVQCTCPPYCVRFSNITPADIEYQLKTLALNARTALDMYYTNNWLTASKSRAHGGVKFPIKGELQTMELRGLTDDRESWRDIHEYYATQYEALQVALERMNCEVKTGRAEGMGSITDVSRRGELGVEEGLELGTQKGMRPMMEGVEDAAKVLMDVVSEGIRETRNGEVAAERLRGEDAVAMATQVVLETAMGEGYGNRWPGF